MRDRYLVRFARISSSVRQTGAPAGFHRGLLPYYERLISGRRVGIVTCHAELAAGLRERMGATSVDHRLVPPQAAIAEGPRADTGHWPGRYRELMRELQTIEPGNLWFVAAGMLGKVYCDVIRDAAGSPWTSATRRMCGRVSAPGPRSKPPASTPGASPDASVTRPRVRISFVPA